MNKQKANIEYNDSGDGFSGAGYVTISDNIIQHNRVQSNNHHHQHRLLVLQNHSQSSSQKASLERKVDHISNQYENTEIQALHFQRLHPGGGSDLSPKKITDYTQLNSSDNPMNSQDEVFYVSRNIAGTKNGNQSRHKTPYQRVYVEQQTIQKQQANNNMNSSSSGNNNNNVSLPNQFNSNSGNPNNNFRFNSVSRKDQTPKNKISIDENAGQKIHYRSVIRDISNDGYYKNTDEYKVNRIYAVDQQSRHQGGAVKEQLNNMLQQQNSSVLKKLNAGRHNSHVYALPNQDSNTHNQSFNIRQIKKKSSISMGESQLTGGGGSGTIITVSAVNNGQSSQIFNQNIQRDRDGSGGRVANQQNSLCKYDSIRNIQNSQDNSSHNISVNNNNNNNNKNTSYQPDASQFQVNIYNNQERQERIQQTYLGNKTNLAKKQMSPQKEIMHSQYETIDINNKRKAKSTQRQQSILRERKQNGNTIHFIHINQSGGSGGGGGSNNNLSLYSLNQNQQNSSGYNNTNNNNSSYESCFASQNANRFYFRSKNNQGNSGAQSSQMQSSVVGGITNQQNTNTINQPSNAANVTNRRQLPQIKDAYNTIDNTATNNPSSSLYKTKNIIKINGHTVDKGYNNRTIDVQPHSSTSKQDKSNKLATMTINAAPSEKRGNGNQGFYEGTMNALPGANLSTANTTRALAKKIQNNEPTPNRSSQAQNNSEHSNATSQNKINSRSQSIRRGRIQHSTNNQINKLANQKENVPTILQYQQQSTLPGTLQLSSCPHKEEVSINGGNRFTSKNEHQKQTNSMPQDNGALTMQDLVDVTVVQKQDKVTRFQENQTAQQQQQLSEERKIKGYNNASIEEQKRCASQTENRPESQVQKDKQNYYKQSYAIEKIQHLKSIETGDVIPTSNKINADRPLNPIHSPLLNRDSSPIPQAHTPTKKRLKNQYQVNQKIEFFPQPPPPTQNIQSQQQSNQTKNKYGQIVQKFQRGNIVKPKSQSNNVSTHQHSSNQQQQQYINKENVQSTSTTNPNSLGGLFNKQTSQMSTNIALSSNQCQDIHELKYHQNNISCTNDPRQISLNVEDDQNEEESMDDNLMKSLQDEVYQEIAHQTIQNKDSALNKAQLQSLENSFQNYFTSSHIKQKVPKENSSISISQKTNFVQEKLSEIKLYSEEPEKPTIDLDKRNFNKITEKNEDLSSSKTEEARRDEFIFSTLDAFNKDRRGSKVAKIIIDFDMDDDSESVNPKSNKNNNNTNNNNISNLKANSPIHTFQQDKNEKNNQNTQKEIQKVDAHQFNITVQSSQKNLIEEPIDSGRASPQVSKPSTAIKPLYYKYNNSYHQISGGADNLDINELTNNQPIFEKFIKNKMSNMRNSYLKQSVRYDNNFFNQQKLQYQQSQQMNQQQQELQQEQYQQQQQQEQN